MRSVPAIPSLKLHFPTLAPLLLTDRFQQVNGRIVDRISHTISDEQHNSNWRESYLSLVKETLISGKNDDQTSHEIAEKLYLIAMDWPSHPDTIATIEDCLRKSVDIFGSFYSQEIATHLQQLVAENSALHYNLAQWSVIEPNMASKCVLQ